MPRTGMNGTSRRHAPTAAIWKRIGCDNSNGNAPTPLSRGRTGSGVTSIRTLSYTGIGDSRQLSSMGRRPVSGRPGPGGETFLLRALGDEFDGAAAAFPLHL